MIFFKKIFYSLYSIFLNFIYFWWRDSFVWWLNRLERAHNKIEKFFAVKINLRYIFSPLYQDYTIVGFLVGVPARAIRISFGIIAHLLVLLVFVFLYFIWAIVPIFVIYKIFKSPF